MQYFLLILSFIGWAILALIPAGLGFIGLIPYMYTAQAAFYEELKKDYTVIVVTHNMQQAARVADMTAFFLLGEIIEFDKTQLMFSTPKDKRTEEYITGRFG